MRHLTFAPVLVLTAALAGAAPAAAQPRVTLAVNGGYQSTTTEFDDSFTFPLHQETATVRTTYPIDAAALFDASGAVRLWRGLGAGVGYSRFSKDGTVGVEASLPHPFFLQRNREISGESGDMLREEHGLHAFAQYALPPFSRLHVVLFGGPSIFDITQSIANGVNFTEEYPYDTATFVGVDSRRVKGTATGFNAGADVRWMFSNAVGVGVLLRVARAQVDLDADDNRTITVDAGGAQFGVGLRLAF